jgi:kynurenine 3-monooxygenase
MPYAQALARGALQDALLRELTDGRIRIDEVDLVLADRLLRDRLTPLASFEERAGDPRPP